MPTLLRKFGSSPSHPTLIIKDGKLACECCEDPMGPPCNNCLADAALPNTVSVTASGFAVPPGLTGCGCFNGSWMLPRFHDCKWLLEQNVTCDGQTRQLTVSAYKDPNLLVVSFEMKNLPGLTVYRTVTYTLSRNNALTCRGTFVLPNIVSATCPGATITLTI